MFSIISRRILIAVPTMLAMTFIVFFLVKLIPGDAARLALSSDETVRVISRRGWVEAPVRIDTELRPGLTFMAIHYPDEVDVNRLTIEAWDPKSGTAEFKATAIRLEKVQ